MHTKITEEKQRRTSINNKARQTNKQQNKAWYASKGQIKSEYIYEIIDFPKKHQKIWCPEVHRAEINQIFRWYFGKSMIS